MAKIEYKTICKDCGADILVDHEKSTENWEVYKNNCDKCGGLAKMVVV